jgi:glycosyltransferase involved in cell wall biosynthesis
LAKVIAVMPIFNEEKTLLDVLRRVSQQADMLVCVNDGSSDSTRVILLEFAKRSKKIFVVDLSSNEGMARALKKGLLFVLYLLMSGLVEKNDIVVTIDADGQHRPEYIKEIVKYMGRKRADIVLTLRDFSKYPSYKKWGNRFLTFTNSILSGFKYSDVESGMRFMRVGTIEPILSYYTGIKYSCAQEIALISARLGFVVDNRFVVRIAYYRPGTTVLDGFIVLFMSLFTFVRCALGLKRPVVCDTSLNRVSYQRSRKLWGATVRKRR